MGPRKPAGGRPRTPADVGGPAGVGELSRRFEVVEGIEEDNLLIAAPCSSFRVLVSMSLMKASVAASIPVRHQLTRGPIAPNLRAEPRFVGTDSCTTPCTITWPFTSRMMSVVG